MKLASLEQGRDGALVVVSTDLSRSLPAGMYIVKVQLDGKVYSKELVVMP